MTAGAVPVLPAEIAAAAGHCWRLLPVQGQGKKPRVPQRLKVATHSHRRLEVWGRSDRSDRWAYERNV